MKSFATGLRNWDRMSSAEMYDSQSKAVLLLTEPDD